MNPRSRFSASAFGALVSALLLAGCAFGPQPVVTRLPPPAASTTAAPATTAPTPSGVPSAPSAAPTGPSTAPVPSTPGVAPGAGDVVSCGDGGSETISGNERTVRVEGRCAELTVGGTALTIDAGTATIGILSLAGDRLRLSAVAIDSATVQGNDSGLTVAQSLGRVELSGDRSTVTAGGTLGALVVRGQDNVVTAGGGIGESTVEGRGNRIG